MQKLEAEAKKGGGTNHTSKEKNTIPSSISWRCMALSFGRNRIGRESKQSMGTIMETGEYPAPSLT
jgi:hypothetical protein